MTKYYSIKYRFYSTAVADILKAIQGGSYGGAFVLTFCCIDYMGLALHPDRENTREDFKEFINSYLTKVNPDYKNLAESLYAIRCSLVHSYGESNASKKTKITPQFRYDIALLSNSHLNILFQESSNNKLEIYLSDFVSEVIASVELFFREQMSNTNDLRIWGDKLFYPQGQKQAERAISIKKGESINHSLIHPFLLTFDIEKNLLKNKIAIKTEIEKIMNKTKMETASFSKSKNI